MKFLGAALALSGLAAAASASDPVARATIPEAKVTYDNYHIYRIRAESPRDIEDIEARLASFHSVHSADALEVAIPPNEVRSFEGMGFDYTLLTRDMGKQIRDEAAHPVTYRRSVDRRGELPDLSWFDSYHSYADHLKYWDDLVAAFPENSEKFTLGPSAPAAGHQRPRSGPQLHPSVPPCEVLYFSTGTGRDFHHGAADASHSWTLELPPANARDGGFILPPAQIWPTVKEQWAGQLYLLNEVRKD
ncbi:conserved hypothetical protein [Verticillium alfalfae VaMs.102]|uniref:Peptidase M14 domain-containing protein n=1 Tax=Verticillium alfalfae (strain VaMs.102 / ATCC MYA-4576 / FGSC 10136) TaxID=526221 RepID=C9SL32_VERA1|nr:conserved hypothetical protein [Verticillium alfalfae VaMs.102]EEY19400.1 conserved hypothetical protein [Verticillium alfalfae VaMs.102]